MIDTKQCGARLRMARQLRGYRTLREFAQATSGRYTETRLGNYETGFRAFPAPVAQDLGKLLDVSPAWLLCLDDERYALSPEESDLVRCYRQADAQGREIIRKVIESLQPVTADECLLVKLYRDAGEGGRSALLRVAESIADTATAAGAAGEKPDGHAA